MVVQQLLPRGWGCSGIAIRSAAPERHDGSRHRRRDIHDVDGAPCTAHAVFVGTAGCGYVCQFFS